MDNSDIITNIKKELEDAETLLGFTEPHTVKLINEIKTKTAILKALKGE